MPNWIEGTMKIRGDHKDIKRFFEEGISCHYMDSNFVFHEIERPRWISIEEWEDNDFQVIFDDEARAHQVYINGTRRAFVDADYGIYYSGNGICCFNIKQAWSFISEQYTEIARKFNLDIKLYGIECGMEFVQEVEITKEGKIITDKEIKFENWEWDCPFPNMGG